MRLLIETSNKYLINKKDYSKRVKNKYFKTMEEEKLK